MTRAAPVLVSVGLLLLTSFVSADAAGGDRKGERGGQPPMPGSHASGIKGQVSIGPVRSVERPGAATQRPYEAHITVLDAAGHEIASVASDADGTFHVPLPPGTYVVRPESAAPYPRASEQRVKVDRDRMTRVTIVYDSGKR